MGNKSKMILISDGECTYINVNGKMIACQSVDLHIEHDKVTFDITGGSLAFFLRDEQEFFRAAEKMGWSIERTETESPADIAR